MENNRSGSTVNKYIQAYKKYCVFSGLGDPNSVTKVKEETRPRLLLSETEALAITQCKPQEKKYTFLWKMLLYSGARPTEIVHLTVNDIDFANNVFYVNRSKTKTGRAVPIAPVLEKEIKDYLNDLETDLLFPTKHNDSKPLENSSYLKEFKERLLLTGIKKKVTPYSFRHSFITRVLVDGNAPLFVVQDIVGHKKADTTRQYYHGSIKAMHEAIQRDPMMKNHLDPWLIINRLLKYITDFLEKDERITKNISIDEETKEVVIRLKVKK